VKAIYQRKWWDAEIRGVVPKRKYMYYRVHYTGYDEVYDAELQESQLRKVDPASFAPPPSPSPSAFFSGLPSLFSSLTQPTGAQPVPSPPQLAKPGSIPTPSASPPNVTQQLLPDKTNKPWKAPPLGHLLHALPEHLSPNRVLLTFDEGEIVHNIVRTLKINRKCIVYIEASPKRSSEFGECQREDYPLLKELMLHLPPTTRWGWERLSTENVVGRFPTVPRYLITSAFMSDKARHLHNPNVVPLRAFIIEAKPNSNADLIEQHGDKDNVLKRRDVEPPEDEGVYVCACVCYVCGWVWECVSRRVCISLCDVCISTDVM
jgi:hypothetical protein